GVRILKNNPSAACTGGGTTFFLPTIAPAEGLPNTAAPFPACTGGTTFVLPTNPPTERLSGCAVATCTGGGITLVFRSTDPEPPRVPISRVTCDGGGATTAGAGKLSFALKLVSRSGVETGGGITSAFLSIGHLAGNGSRCSPLGGGGTTVAASDGATRVEPCATDGGGGITFAAGKDGALREPRTGFGGGGTAEAGRVKERCDDFRPSAGAGPGILFT